MARLLGAIAGKDGPPMCFVVKDDDGRSTRFLTATNSDGILTSPTCSSEDIELDAFIRFSTSNNPRASSVDLVFTSLERVSCG